MQSLANLDHRLGAQLVPADIQLHKSRTGTNNLAQVFKVVPLEVRLNQSELLQLALLDKLPQKSVQSDWAHFTADQSQLFQVVWGRLKHQPRELRQ